MLLALIITQMCVWTMSKAPDVSEEPEESIATDSVDTELDAGPVTEQVMEPNITLNKPGESEANDEETEMDEEPLDMDFDINRVIRDIGYYLRAHKFHDYDRRYYKSITEMPKLFYEQFPKPALRSLHWEVHKNCDNGFHHCLKYMQRILIMTSLKRVDDTVTVMRDQKWNLTNHTKQILAAQRDCQMAQRRDNLTFAPFQGPIERFQWRTSASYYMCWYTMLEKPELKVFGEPCDNHANCLDKYGPNNKDPRANDDKPFGCALYSFCPDHCCSMNHIWYTRDCYQSNKNPCYRSNRPGNRKCSLNREENQDMQSLMRNEINITCECQESGYEWSSRFGLCVDINECTRGLHNCDSKVGQSCVNLPGSFDCICTLGFVYSSETQGCVFSRALKKAFQPEAENDESEKKKKSIFALIVNALTKSSSSTTKHNRQKWCQFFLLFTSVLSNIVFQYYGFGVLTFCMLV